MPADQQDALAGPAVPSTAPNPRKRRRRDTRRHGHSKTDQEDAVLALEVDIMILDYQAYRTTHALLEASRNHGYTLSSATQNQLVLFDSFAISFRRRHPNYQPDDALKLRLLLLQFCTLKSRRYTYNESTPSMTELEALRAESSARVRRWIASQERVPSIDYDATFLEQMPSLNPAQLACNRTHVLDSLSIDTEDRSHYGSQACVSLLDLLPTFMSVCALAYQTRHSINITSTMRIMSDFMLQATLEQYLVYGRHSTVDPIDEAFAWGCFADAESEVCTEGSKVDYRDRHTANGEDVTMCDADESGTALDDIAKGGLRQDHLRAAHSPCPSRQYSHASDPQVNGSQTSPQPDLAHHRSSHILVPEVDTLHNGSSTSHEQNGLPGDGTTAPIANQTLTGMDQAIDAMFRDDSGKQSDIWTSAKRFALDQLFRDPGGSSSAWQHLQELATTCPVKDFDHRLLQCLQRCAELVDLPVLLQIEHGQLFGKSEEDTNDFLKRCGLRRVGHLL